MTLTLTADNAEHMMKQAHMTASEYAIAAEEYIERRSTYFEGWSNEAKATFMSGYMRAAALDFLAASNLSGGQHVAEAIASATQTLGFSIDSVAESLAK